MFSSLVVFPDGTYGARSHWFFGWYYYDLKTRGCQWKPRDKFFRDCKGTREQALATLPHNAKTIAQQQIPVFSTCRRQK